MIRANKGIRFVGNIEQVAGTMEALLEDFGKDVTIVELREQIIRKIDDSFMLDEVAM